MMIQHVRKWCHEFSEGRRDVHVAVWLGHPRASTEDTVNTIRALLDEDRRLSIRQLEFLMKGEMRDLIAGTTIAVIVKNNLNFCKVCACWVPHQLTEHTKKSNGGSIEFFGAILE